MRKLSLLILLATVAAPAMAAGPNDRGGRHDGDHAEKSESRSERVRPNRSEAREQRSQAREQNSTRGSDNREQRAFGAQRSERSQANQQGTTEQIRARYLARQQQTATTRSEPNESVRNWRGRDRQGTSTTTQAQTNWRERERRVRTIPDTTPTATQQTSRERSAFRDRDRHRRDYRDGNFTRWSSSQWHNWRNDGRYDWRRYRDRNRSHFRIGIYFDPFGYNYRRWSVGSFLNAGYYGSSYWLNDPWQYRLPPAYGPYRWVRYWNDALLVNIYTGEVEDVIHGFFW